MLPNNSLNLKEKFLLLLYASIFIAEIFTFFTPIKWIISNDQLTNWQYWYLFLPIIANPLAIYGIYLLSKFNRKGFPLFYFGYASSSFMDFTRAKNLESLLIIVLGNLFFLTIFIFLSRRIAELSR